MVVASSSSLPRMGLGMAALGRPGYITLDRSSILGKDRSVAKMQQQANVVMDSLFAAVSDDNSIPWLDCARSYGLSERFVGEYLKSKSIQPDQVHVSSKWGYTYVADWNVELEKGKAHEVKDHSVENFLKQVEETSEYLGEYLNLYQIHSATFESGVLEDIQVHEALSKCRKERGWAIGLSVSGPKQDHVLQKAMEIKSTINPDERLFDEVQITFNVLESRPADILLEAHDAGMDIVIKEGLANGRIFKNPVVIECSKTLKCEPDQLALGCILAQPFKPRVLSGAVTPEQLLSNLKALDASENLLKGNSALVQEILSTCAMKSEDYWSERSALAWN